MATPSFLSPSLLAALVRRPALTLLPRVPVEIRLHEPQKRPDDPRRLNLFPGRALGEREMVGLPGARRPPGQRGRAAGIERVCFDRGGYLYHGRVKAIADGAREGGLTF